MVSRGAVGSDEDVKQVGRLRPRISIATGKWTLSPGRSSILAPTS
jgi:hypothetical protein